MDQIPWVSHLRANFWIKLKISAILDVLIVLRDKKLELILLPTSSADSRIDIVGGVYVEEAFATLVYNYKACN